MRKDAELIRQGGPVVFAQVKHDVNVDNIIEHIKFTHKQYCTGN